MFKTNVKKSFFGRYGISFSCFLLGAGLVGSLHHSQNSVSSNSTVLPNATLSPSQKLASKAQSTPFFHKEKNLLVTSIFHGPSGKDSFFASYNGLFNKSDSSTKWNLWNRSGQFFLANRFDKNGEGSFMFANVKYSWITPPTLLYSSNNGRHFAPYFGAHTSINLVSQIRETKSKHYLFAATQSGFFYVDLQNWSSDTQPEMVMLPMGAAYPFQSVSDNNDDVFITTSYGIYEFVMSGQSPKGHLVTNNPNFRTATSLKTSTGKTVYLFGTGGHGLYWTLTPSDPSTYYRFGNGLPFDLNISHVNVDAKGNIWVGTNGQGLWYKAHNLGTWALVPTLLGSRICSNIYMDSAGYVWVATWSNGLWKSNQPVG